MHDDSTSPVVATSSTSWRVPGGLTGQLPTRFKFPPVRSVLWYAAVGVVAERNTLTSHACILCHYTPYDCRDRTPLGEKVVLGWSQCRKLLAFTPGALECMHSFLVVRLPTPHVLTTLR